MRWVKDNGYKFTPNRKRNKLYQVRLKENDSYQIAEYIQERDCYRIGERLFKRDEFSECRGVRGFSPSPRP